VITMPPVCVRVPASKSVYLLLVTVQVAFTKLWYERYATVYLLNVTIYNLEQSVITSGP
jgi:hypothetical protein